MNVVGVGIIGVGVMGAAHARLIATAVPGARVAAVYDPDPERAGDLATEVGATVVRSAQELIASPAVTAVIVAAPDPSHEELTSSCVAAGKPTLCEKPLAVTSEGTRRVVEAELAAGRRLVQVGFMRRYDPGFAELRRVVADEEFGVVRLVHCLHRNAQAHPDATSEGVVSNSMIHELDQVPWLLGSPISAITVSAPRAGKAEGDLLDTQVAVLEAESGAMATVEVSLNAGYGYDVQCEVVGERGTARLAAPYGILVREAARDARPVTSDWVGRFAEAYRLELVAWVGSIRDGRPTGPSAWDGHLATLVAEAGVRSLRGGGRVGVEAGEAPALYQSERQGQGTGT